MRKSGAPRRWTDSRLSLTQRIRRLDDIGSAAGPFTRRIEHETLGSEGVGNQRAPRRKIAGDRAWGGASQARQRDVGRISARLGLNSDAPETPLLFSLKVHQSRFRLYLGHDRPRLIAAEPAQSVAAHQRLGPADAAERLVDVVGNH